MSAEHLSTVRKTLEQRSERVAESLDQLAALLDHNTARLRATVSGTTTGDEAEVSRLHAERRHLMNQIEALEPHVHQLEKQQRRALQDLSRSVGGNTRRPQKSRPASAPAAPRKATKRAHQAEPEYTKPTLAFIERTEAVRRRQLRLVRTTSRSTSVYVGATSHSFARVPYRHEAPVHAPVEHPSRSNTTEAPVNDSWAAAVAVGVRFAESRARCEVENAERRAFANLESAANQHDIPRNSQRATLYRQGEPVRNRSRWVAQDRPSPAREQAPRHDMWCAVGEVPVRDNLGEPAAASTRVWSPQREENDLVQPRTHANPEVKAAEQAARLKATEGEAARCKTAEEEVASVKAAEEEAARVKAAEEEAARTKAAEEEAARVKAAAALRTLSKPDPSLERAVARSAKCVEDDNDCAVLGEAACGLVQEMLSAGQPLVESCPVEAPLAPVSGVPQSSADMLNLLSAAIYRGRLERNAAFEICRAYGDQFSAHLGKQSELRETEEGDSYPVSKFTPADSGTPFLDTFVDGLMSSTRQRRALATARRDVPTAHPPPAAFDTERVFDALMCGKGIPPLTVAALRDSRVSSKDRRDLVDSGVALESEALETVLQQILDEVTREAVAFATTCCS